jgi:hypothetical protein
MSEYVVLITELTECGEHWLLFVMGIVTVDTSEFVIYFYTFHVSNILYHICAHVEVDCDADG